MSYYDSGSGEGAPSGSGENLTLLERIAELLERVRQISERIEAERQSQRTDQGDEYGHA